MFDFNLNELKRGWLLPSRQTAGPCEFWRSSLISFALEEDQLIARDMSAQFARDLLGPAAQSADRGQALPDELLNQLWGLGLVAQQLDSDDRVTNAILLEELAVGDATAALAISAPMGFARAIAAYGTSDQQRWGREFLGGDRFTACAIAMTEPGFGADVRQPKTCAEATANGWVLNGVKAMVPLVSVCTYFLVLATDSNGLAMFLVPADNPGVKKVSAPPTLGLRALGLGELHLSDVVLDGQARLGGDAIFHLEPLIAASRTAAAMVLGGLCRSVFDYTVPYTKERIAHGSAIAQKQSVAFRFADMHIEIEAIRWMAWRAASELAHGLPEAQRSAQLAFTYAGEHAVWISDEGIQLLGGHGFLRGHPVEMWYRNARTLSVIETLGGV